MGKDDKKEEEKPVKASPPPHSKTKVKNKFVDLQPVMYRLGESHDDRVEQLVRYGLGDFAKMSFYRRALSDPKGSVSNPQLREYVGEALSRLMALVMGDEVLFRRVMTLLQTRGDAMRTEEVQRLAMNLRSLNKASGSEGDG